MSTQVCLLANTLTYPEGGGHLWVYLNWALGLRSTGVEVIWLEAVEDDIDAEQCERLAVNLNKNLAPYGFSGRIAISGLDGSQRRIQGCLEIDAAAECELLLNFRYDVGNRVVSRFKRSALIDIDPGLLQIWLAERQISIARHDVYFTTGETVGAPGSLIPKTDIDWCYTPPCVALDYWNPHPAANVAPWTTISHWCGDEWVYQADGFYVNDKRAGFVPFFELPKCVSKKLELALCMASDEEEEKQRLIELGWTVRNALEVAGTPSAYQTYIQNSFGEFSCVKPSCVRLQNAWVSDRTLCYLASAKPAVIQNTGKSQMLSSDAGLLRFTTLEEAVECLETAAADYDYHCRAARQLVEECFDAQKIASHALEIALCSAGCRHRV